MRKHKLPTWPLDKPIPAINADSTKNAAGSITRVTELRVSIGDHTEKIMFAIVRLDGHDLYLGFSRLNLHNPEIDWTHRMIYFTRCPRSCNYHTGHAMIISVRVPVSVGIGTRSFGVHTCIRCGTRGNGYLYSRIQVPAQAQVLTGRPWPQVYTGTHEYTRGFLIEKLR